MGLLQTWGLGLENSCSIVIYSIWEFSDPGGLGWIMNFYCNLEHMRILGPWGVGLEN